MSSVVGQSADGNLVVWAADSVVDLSVLSPPRLVVPHQEAGSAADLVVVVGAVEASVVEDVEDSVDEADSTTGLEGLVIEAEEGSMIVGASKTVDLEALVTVAHPAATAGASVVEEGSEVAPVEVGLVIGEVGPAASAVGTIMAHQAADSGSYISLLTLNCITYLVLSGDPLVAAVSAIKATDSTAQDKVMADLLPKEALPQVVCPTVGLDTTSNVKAWAVTTTGTRNDLGTKPRFRFAGESIMTFAPAFFLLHPRQLVSLQDW